MLINGAVEYETEVDVRVGATGVGATSAAVAILVEDIAPLAPVTRDTAFILT